MEMTVITVSGTDNTTFLQGLLTCDVSTLNETPVFAASCNQKGRIIANFWIWKTEANYHLYLPKNMASLLIDHLKKFQFRAKVAFESAEPNPAYSSLEESLWILPETTEQFTPQMIDLQKHGGVSFKKGCYLGQEIIARTEHLGQLKRHLYIIDIEPNNSVKISDDIKNERDEKMGTVVGIINGDVFAVIEDRAIQEKLNLNKVVISNITRPD